MESCRPFTNQAQRNRRSFVVEVKLKLFLVLLGPLKPAVSRRPGKKTKRRHVASGGPWLNKCCTLFGRQRGFGCLRNVAKEQAGRSAQAKTDRPTVEQ